MPDNNYQKRIDKLEDISSRQEARLMLLEEIVKDVKEVLKELSLHIRKSVEMTYRIDGACEQTRANLMEINKNKKKLQTMERAIFKWGLIISAISAFGTLIGSTLLIKLVDTIWK